MKLQARFKKTLALTAVATTLFSCMPAVAFASDYTGHWAETTINEWKDKGVIDGYEDGSFKPKQEVTRAELAKMITKVFGLTYTEGAAKYNDVAADAWYAQDIKAVSAAGLMLGENGNFRPNEIATREEAAYAIATAYHITGQAKKEYKDQADISKFAVEAVNALTANGYMNGYPEDGTFRPQGSLTRAEAVTILDKITAEIINTAGTYTQDTQGNLVVNTKDVVLKDMVINGNLYLAEGIGEGSVTLDGVTVTGDIIVEGGGINTVNIKGKSKVKNILVSKTGTNPVKIVVAGTVVVTGTVEVNSATVIEGTAAKLPEVVVNGAGTLEIKGTVEVKSLAIATPTTLTLTGSGVVLDKVVVDAAAEKTAFRGNGTIKELQANANHIKYAGGIIIDKTTVGSAVTTPPTKESTGGGGGGGGKPPVVSESFTLGDATITMKDESSVTVSLAKSAITVDATGENIKIGEGTFTPDMAIVSAQAHVSIPEVKVSAVVAATTDDVTLKSDHPYTLGELVVEVNNKKQFVNEMVELFAVAQGEIPTADKPLTYEQGQKILGWMNKAIGTLEEGAKDGEVTVQAIQQYIKEAKTKINAHGGVTRINDSFGPILEFMGITLVDNNGTITAKFNIQVSASGYTTKTVEVTVIF